MSHNFTDVVNAGAEWLDQEAPGWELKLNLQELEMSDCFRCVLGQIWGDYYDVAQPLINEDRDWARNRGFSVFVGRDLDWEELGDAWVRFIKERLDAGITI